MATYTVAVKCQNCDHQCEVTPEKGTPYSEVPCPNCETQSLQKDPNPPQA